MPVPPCGPAVASEDAHNPRSRRDSGTPLVLSQEGPIARSRRQAIGPAPIAVSAKQTQLVRECRAFAGISLALHRFMIPAYPAQKTRRQKKKGAAELGWIATRREAFLRIRCGAHH